MGGLLNGDGEEYLGHLYGFLAIKDFAVIGFETTKNTLLSVSALALLSGCATPKPNMPNSVYENFAQGYAVVQNCGISGQMSPDAALWSKRMLNNKLNTYAFDPAFLEGRYQAVNPSLSNPPAEVCNQFAMAAEEYKQRVQAGNAQVEANARAVESQIQNNRTVNTYCNKIGTQTICNSY
ncbi:hypothetical protein [Pseudomonas fluorescens]|uniref:hypothetical protein n=1 Tax=Pseudomonas fluorescens TaxID=294 RepID=UPI00123FA1DB|nr:hypothetical protein [Pseudomonas fluorescens]